MTALQRQALPLLCAYLALIIGVFTFWSGRPLWGTVVLCILGLGIIPYLFGRLWVHLLTTPRE